MVFHIIIPQTRRHYKRFLLFFCVGTPRFPPESRRVPNDARPAAPGSGRVPGRPGAKADAQALHSAAASAFCTAYCIHFHRNASAAKPKRPASRAFRAAERRSAPSQAIQSHTLQSVCKALPADRVQSPFQNRFGIVYTPVCVLFCAITRKICLISRFPNAHRSRRCA